MKVVDVEKLKDYIFNYSTIGLGEFSQKEQETDLVEWIDNNSFEMNTNVVTLRDVVLSIEPEMKRSIREGGIDGCPCQYKYLNIDSARCPRDAKDNIITCYECWSRPFIERSE